MMTPAQFATLLDQYLNDTLDAEGLQQLRAALDQEQFREQFEAAIDRQLQLPAAAGPEAVKARLWERLQPAATAGPEMVKAQLRNTPAQHRTVWWPRLAVAASLLLLISAGALYWKLRQPAQGTVVAHKALPVPGSDKAILTLADGTQVTLDSANTTLAMQGNSQVQLSGGQLAYNGNGTTGPVQYNMLQVPRGGQFRIVLADGSRVWLNAASTLRYPASFQGSDRTVELTGEAYFEIAPAANQPFFVKVNNNTIQVLGTSFNVMAYTEEPTIRTTLLEGAIALKTPKVTTRLQPGQLATTTPDGSTNVATAPDVEEMVAWKNGYFMFNHEKIPGVMRQIARWYDVEIEYAGKIPADREFGGKINRNSSIEEVIRILELSKIHVKLSNHKIIVQP
ncbi:FecR family protein [Chitinophaga sp. sic0106]|uniref:FecR family protein n=1 Tax=Chitinophaga sp. sic0106 TaxID=2854785 RepID=UPI001C451D3F|nr:FecR domain-containing protein [Chitinophaga sp. sic0106]MBV7529765.1 FecR domain-containing protein [Chitinophaga sp. sic0106]